jgi:hypothetical protein
VWEAYAPTLHLLGGIISHAGENVGDACALDLAMLIFYMAAEGAFQEALAYAQAHDISARRLLDHPADGGDPGPRDPGLRHARGGGRLRNRRGHDDSSPAYSWRGAPSRTSGA